MAWEGSEVPAAPQLGEMIPRCGPGDDNTEENPVDEVEKIERVLAAWKAHGLGSGLEAEYAEVAVRALEPTCGAQHPQRPQVVCTTPPHDVAGPTWCRNDAMKLEWDPGTGTTVHDDLGSITLHGPSNPRILMFGDAGVSSLDQFSGTSGEVGAAIAGQEDEDETTGLDVETVLAASRMVYRDLIPILNKTVETLQFVQDREGRKVTRLTCVRVGVSARDLTTTIRLLQGEIIDTA